MGFLIKSFKKSFISQLSIHFKQAQNAMNIRLQIVNV